MRAPLLLCAVLSIYLVCQPSNALIVEPYEHEEPYHEKYYQYGYQVEDHYTGDYHGHMEHTAGHLTKGEYKVKLPDGRVQVVSYEADHAGFRPRVTYEGSSVAGRCSSGEESHSLSLFFRASTSTPRSLRPQTSGGATLPSRCPGTCPGPDCPQDSLPQAGGDVCPGTHGDTANSTSQTQTRSPRHNSSPPTCSPSPASRRASIVSASNYASSSTHGPSPASCRTSIIPASNDP